MLKLNFSIACTIITTLSISSAIAQTLPDADVISVKERPRYDYDAKGINAGSWVFKPALSSKVHFRDNLYATPNSEISDTVYVVNPALYLTSNWSQHMLGISAYGSIGMHNDNDDEDYEDFQIKASGKLDVLKGMSLNGNTYYQQKHEKRSSPNSVNGTTPTEYSITGGTVWFTRDRGRVSLKLDGTIDKYAYQNVRSGMGLLIDNEQRDRDEYIAGFKLGYEFKPNYSAFISGNYDWRQYENGGFEFKDSTGYQINVGTEIDISGKLKSDAYIGYLEREFDSMALNKISSIAYGGNILWTPTGLTSINLGVDQKVEESVQLNTSGYISSIAKADIEHELRRNIILSGGIGYQVDDFESTGAVQREDDVIIAELGADYLLRKGVKLNAGYEFEERDSNVNSSDYSDNIFTLGVSLAY